jgi:uncharacterized protein with PIN domain
MKNEIIDAIREYYKDDESMTVDCLSWLSTGNLLELVEVARDELISMNYCPYCGSKLQTFTWREYHPEVDEPMRFEEMSEMCCPNCDFS